MSLIIVSEVSLAKRALYARKRSRGSGKWQFSTQSQRLLAFLHNMTALVPQFHPAAVIFCVLIEQKGKFLKTTLSLFISVALFAIVKSAFLSA